MITITQKGDFSNTERFFRNAQKLESIRRILESYGPKGVNALAIATPRDTGQTAAAWSYKIEVSGTSYSIGWYNSHEENGIKPAFLIQYGHGTRGGTYVPGIDYINPAIRPILDGISDDIWKEVCKL
jgi:hypothetical protein